MFRFTAYTDLGDGTHSNQAPKLFFSFLIAVQKPASLSSLLEEQYEMEGNRVVGFKGLILTRFDGISLMDMTRLAREVKEVLDELGVGDVGIEEKGLVEMKYDHAVKSRSQTLDAAQSAGVCLLT